MRAVALGYHDIVADERRAASGFTTPGADRYKLSPEAFAAHLRAIVAAAGRPALAAAIGAAARPPLLITFDDGGDSSLAIADALEAHGCLGHFFVCPGLAGRPGFATAADLRALHARGHLVGSHSVDHPPRIDRLPPAEQLAQWRDSRAALEDMLGAPVRVASVPGGHYAPSVARAAARAGLTLLFTSNPTTRVRRVAGCAVAGRYFLRRGDPPALAAALASGRGLARGRQAAAWRTRRLVARATGPLYERLRARLLQGAGP